MRSLFNFSRGLLALKGGFGSLTDKLHEECSDEVRLSSRVKRIVVDGLVVKGVDTDEGFVEADAVICATTAGIARDIIDDMPDGMRKALETVRYSKCRHICFCLEDRLLPRGWYAGAIPRKAGSFLPAIVDSSEKTPDHAPPGAGQVHCFTYGRRASEYDDLPDKKLAELMMEEVRRFIPSMPDKPLFYLHCRWDEAICLEPPGMLAAIERLRSGDCGKVRGLYFAGSYMRLLSSVEGSLRSGEEAAMEALRYA